MIDVADRDAIASLVGSRPYKLVLDELESGVHNILAKLSTAASDQEILFLARLYQAFFHNLQFLRSEPLSIKDELDKELQSQPWLQYTKALGPDRAKNLAQIESLMNDGY